jgi:hypothetical protein
LVDLDINNQPIHDLFEEIERQTELSFSFNTRLIDRDELISYQSNQQPVEKVINKVFDGRIDAKIIGNHMVLVENRRLEKKAAKKNKELELLVFTGILTNSRTLQPIANASVYDVGSRQTTLSDSTGLFTLTNEKASPLRTFNIAKDLYKDTVISVDLSIIDTLDIKLLPKSKAYEPMLSKQAHKIDIETKSDFMLGMVPREGLYASENLNEIYEKRVAQVSFIPIVGTNLTSSGIIENKFSLNILGGYNGAVRGVELGGLMNIIDKNVLGLQVAGLANLVAGKTTGVQVGGLLNKTNGKLNGIQVAGIANFSSSYVQGIQVGGVLNWASDTVRGLQVAGICNINKKSVEGIQLAGVSNLLNGNLKGMQLSGVANICREELIGIQASSIHNHARSVEGIQVSSISNMTTDKMAGIQLTSITNIAAAKMNGLQVSLVNTAKTNNGLQIGLLNFADSSNGVAIGLFNFVRNGYHTIELSANEFFYTNARLKLGARHFYNTYSFGLNPTANSSIGVGMGFGSNFNLYKKLSLSIDLSSTWVRKSDTETSNSLNRFELSLDYRITKDLTLSLGPSYNVYISDNSDLTTESKSAEMAIKPFYSKANNAYLTEMWIGAQLGLRYHF